MMNFEAISAELYPYSVDDNLIVKSCIDYGVDDKADYAINSKKVVTTVAVAILRNLIVLSSEGNGGYSLSYNVDRLKERIHILAKENGLIDIADEFDPKSKIIDVSDKW